MYRDMDDRYNFRAKMLIASILVLFVAFVSFLGVLLSSIGNNSVKVVNASDAKNNGLPSEVINRASKTIYSFLKKKGYDVSQSQIVVRDITLQEEDSGYFLFDVDSIQQTYRYYYADDINLVGCPYIRESKYPNSYCIGNSRENDDTATIIFGTDLPYEGSTKTGVKYRIFRKDLDHNLYVHIYGCSTDATSSDAVKNMVNTMISDRGANPDSFPIKYEYNYCPKK